MAGSDTAPVYFTEKPTTPTKLTIRRTADDAIRLEWAAVANATGYRVEHRTDAAAEWMELGHLSSDSTQCDHVGSGAGQGSYRLQASNSGGASDYTQPVTLQETPLTPLEKWRMQHFATAENEGVAADTYVGTADGLNNFTKYALGINPGFAAPVVSGFAPGKPKTEMYGDQFSLVFNHPVDRTDVKFEVLYSEDLGTWTPVIHVSDGVQDGIEIRRASVTASGKRQFMKLKAIRV